MEQSDFFKALSRAAKEAADHAAVVGDSEAREAARKQGIAAVGLGLNGPNPITICIVGTCLDYRTGVKPVVSIYFNMNRAIEAWNYYQETARITAARRRGGVA